jgi:hypothetical protein
MYVFRNGSSFLTREGLLEERERESGDVVRDTIFGEGARNCISSFEGFQKVPARPSGRDNAYDRNLFLYDVGSAALY